MSAKLAKRIGYSFATEYMTWPQFQRQLEELADRIHDEMDERVFFCLSNEMGSIFCDDDLFGGNVHHRFPSLVFEFDEARKCLAFARHTAAVFHLMRAMEGGIAAVRACLGIPDPTKRGERNWGAILRRIKDELDRRNTNGGPGWGTASDKDLFDEIYVSLDAVRNTWRNSTMHVEKIYTEEEAKHILNAVKIFMTKLADRLDEAGMPRA